MRAWRKDCSDAVIEAAALVGYGDGKILLRKFPGVDIAIPLEELSNLDVEYVLRITGMSFSEIHSAPGNSSEGILRPPLVLDDLYQALYHGFCRSARGAVTRCHLETLLSPIVLKVLIRIRFNEAKRPRSLSHILRGVVIVGRCLQTRYYIPKDGHTPRLWTLRSLLAACYRRRLFHFHLPERSLRKVGGQGRSATAETTIAKQVKWLYSIVCATNLWDRYEDLTSGEAMDWAAKNMDIPVHDLFGQYNGRTPEPSSGARAEGPSFPSRDINIRTLKELGGLQLQWTDNHADHLKLSSTSQGKRLSIFWNRTSYDLSNTAYYRCGTPFVLGRCQTDALKQVSKA